MNVPCNVILDLLPLVKDNIASSESTHLVNDHIIDCVACKAEFDSYQPIKVEQVTLKDKKIIFDIKRSIFVTQLVILIIGAIVGIALSDSMGMFYNLIIMPIIGGVSYFSFQKKWDLSLIGIFCATYVWQTGLHIMSQGFTVGTMLYGLYIGLYFSLLYTFLAGVGVIIAMLLKFALRKER